MKKKEENLDEFHRAKSNNSLSMSHFVTPSIIFKVHVYITYAYLNFCVYTPAGDRAFGNAMVCMPHRPRNSSQKSRQRPRR